MTDADWKRFFALVDKIVSMENLTADERAALIRSEAEKYGSLGNLEELCAEVEE